MQSKQFVGLHFIQLSLHDYKYFAQNFLVLRWELINVAICWRIGNLKNTHVGAHRSVPRQPYIGAPMYGPSIHRSYCPYVRGWSMHRSSDVRTCNPTYGYVYTHSLLGWLLHVTQKKLFLQNLFLMQFKISCLVGVSLHCLRGFCGIELKKNLPGEYFDRLSRTLSS